MNRTTRWIVLALVLVLVLGCAYLLYDWLAEEYDPGNIAAVEGEDEVLSDESVTVPDFTVVDAQGNSVRLSDFRGKPVVLNLWASWCSPCKNEMPEFEEAYAQYGDEIHFLMVNVTDGVQETQATAGAFLSEAGYTFPVYFDTQLSAYSAYSTGGIPMTYFISADGGPVAYAQGMISGDSLQQGIDLLLEQE